MIKNNTIQQLSPYGKDVRKELHDVYGMSSLDHLLDEARAFLTKTYGLESVRFQSIHVAYCLCIKFTAAHKTYYLKFTAPSITDMPDELFAFVDFLYHKGLPVPSVVQTQSGTWWNTMLGDTPYAITYLLPEMPGTPIQGQPVEQVLNYARTMARFHLHGQEFAMSGTIIMSGEPSRKMIFERMPDELPPLLPLLTEAYADLFSPETIAIIKKSIDLLLRDTDRVGYGALEKTHIYGDMRMCHVFEKEDQVVGLIDIDQATYVERLLDVCYGIISAPEPDDGKALSWRQQVAFLEAYHRLYPFTSQEISALPYVLSWANLVQLEDLIGYYNLSAGTVTREKLIQNVFEIEHILEPGAFDFLKS